MTVYIYASCTCIGWMYWHEGCNQQTSDKFLTQHLKNAQCRIFQRKKIFYVMSVSLKFFDR